jgi:hypothetical protein
MMAEVLFSGLRERGHCVWLDVKMDKCDEMAMKEGVENSSVFLAVVTDDGSNSYFSREMCCQEVRWAREAGKLIVPVIATVDKQRVGDFIAEGLRHGLDFSALNFVELNRGGPHFLEASFRTLLEQAGRADVRRQSVAIARGRSMSHVSFEPEPEDDSI